MKLSEALKIVQTASLSNAEKLTVSLACGFTPLHLSTFLAAHLKKRLPGERAVKIQTGIYGDLFGSLELLQKSSGDVGVLIIEWSDLDPRLGWRSLGGWSPHLLAEIQDNVQSSVNRILRLLKSKPQLPLTVACLPTLPLPPISYLPTAQLGLNDLWLKRIVQDFALSIAELTNIKILNQSYLDEIVPLSERFDIKSELTSGFPYRLGYASRLAEVMGELIQPPLPKKGLITDLDDTLWRGILGEIGVEGISWELDRQSHIHALYQQLLAALADSGALIGVASKNDRDLVLKAFERNDLIAPKDRLFPLEANWQQKSLSVHRILKAWNINADAVVFVDDSPLELAEVKAVHPEMECLLFPKNDAEELYQFLKKLRGMFGKPAILEEDVIRVESLRRAKEFQDEAANSGAQPLEDFLENLGAKITFSSIDADGESRAFELINKTNQFNLNGKRLSNGEFQNALQRRGAVSLVVSYQDKFGPLGKIAVLLGSVASSVLKVDTWVMSCRAFSRHIEHKCLDYLFEHYVASAIELDYEPTPRNEPTRQFLLQFSEELASPCTIEREVFNGKKPKLFHSISENIYG